MFPNLDERQPDEKISTTDYKVDLPELNDDELKSKSGIEIIDSLVEFAVQGGTIGQLSRAQFKTLEEDNLVNESLPIRLIEPFEQLRANADKHLKKHGKRPQVFLANFGQLYEYNVRMDFTCGFYEVGGFELIDKGGYDTVESALQATLDSNILAVVICSTDDKYVDVVPEFTQAIKARKPHMVVILAGYPKDKVEEYRQADVDDFIHIRANCYEMNKTLQERLGVGK